MTDENVIRTKDFYLSAYLMASGVKLLRLDRTEPRRVFFVFRNPEGTEDLVEDFLFGRARVEPKQFAAAIREAKQLLHAEDD